MINDNTESVTSIDLEPIYENVRKALENLSFESYNRIMSFIGYENLTAYAKEDESLWKYLYATLEYNSIELKALVDDLKEFHRLLHISDEEKNEATIENMVANYKNMDYADRVEVMSRLEDENSLSDSIGMLAYNFGKLAKTIRGASEK